jgi:phosphatidylglycerophosphate synthase
MDIKSVIPKEYLHILVCLCSLTYMNLDSIDGKLARLTKQSSPMGKALEI